MATLRVDPEGIPESITQSVLISKNDTNSNFTASLSCTLPNTAVNDTTSVSAAVFGDILGDMLSNLVNLIQMSSGCGEQNLINFVPNIIALFYLEATGQLTAALRAKAVAYALNGYILELTYRRYDGSFSAFGNNDVNGSTWLSSYVAKAFTLAKPYITVDQNVIDGALTFVLSKQNPDGSFREDGNVIHKSLQGGSGTGLAMTAYISTVLSAILPAVTDPKYELARNKSLDYIAANIDYTDVYELAISTYALSFVNHSALQNVSKALWDLRIETPSGIHWDKPDTNVQDQSTWWWNSQPQSEAIEITAYALLYFVNIDLSISALIAKYLVSKKNSFGGYTSSQDTIEGIQALANFASVFRQNVGTLDIHFKPNLGNEFDAQVNAVNLLTVQTFDLNPFARQLNVSTGVGSKGTCIASLTCNFYILDKETSPRFIITHEFVRPCNNKLLRVHVCLTYISREGDYFSNMVLMETRLPSGYIHDTSFPQDIIIKVSIM